MRASVTTSLVSLADLAAVEVRLSPTEGATIVHELLQQVSRGELPGVPSAHVIRLGGNGLVSVEGPVSAGGRGVSRAAQLLDTLLPGFDAPPEHRVPGALRLVLARALGALDLPVFASIESFSAALARFAAPDPAARITDILSRWATAIDARGAGAAVTVDEPVVPEKAEVRRLATIRQDLQTGSLIEGADDPSSLTISDIRRARRATGLTLTDIAERSRIPAWLLRELEWGYLRNWPCGHYGRTQLLRYAQASGLDGQIVVQTVWPMLDGTRADAVTVVPALMSGGAVVEGVVADDREGAPGTSAVVAAPISDTASEKSRRSRVLAALAIPALLAIGLAPALWHRAAESPDVAAPPTLARNEPAASVPVTPNRQPVDVRPAGPAAPEPALRVPEPKGPASTAPSPGAAAVDERPDVDPQPQRVLPDAAVYSPSFASAGSAMFYHAESEGDSKLMRADTDSRGAILRVTSVVDDNARNFHARPSPGGDRIAFDSDREGERAVFVADANGENVRRVSGEGFAAIPSWSPDGRTLTYVRAEPDRPRVWNLWSTDLESGGEKRLTSFRVGQPWGASWFPDGRRIAYSHETRLIVQDLTTGKERIFPSPIKGRLVRTPAVSPDGRRILFQVYRDGAWLLDMSDGSMRRVLSDPSAEEYTWSPDGRRVAYHSRQSGNWGVWVMASR